MIAKVSAFLAAHGVKITTHTIAVVLGAASVAFASYASTGRVDAESVLRALGFGQ